MPTSKDSTITCPARQPGRGFSLVELLVSVALISVMAVAVGLAVHHAMRRTSQAKANLTHLQRKSDVFRMMAEDFRWATDVLYFNYKDGITFRIPSLDNPGTFDLIDYYWVMPENNLYRARNIEPYILILENVPEINFNPDVVLEDGSNRLRGINISAHVGTNQEDVIQRYFEFLNKPPWF